MMCDCNEGDNIEIENRLVRRCKDFKCGECGVVIEAGQEFRQRSYVEWDVYENQNDRYYDEAYKDSDLDTHVYCVECDDIMEAFSDVGLCWFFGEFLSAYWNWLDGEGKRVPLWLMTKYFKIWSDVNNA